MTTIADQSTPRMTTPGGAALGFGRDTSARRDLDARTGMPCRREWRSVIVGVLNHALGVEIAHMQRYVQQHFVADGRGSIKAPRKFIEHASDDVDHADRLALRVQELGGAVELRPSAVGAAAAAEAAGTLAPQQLIQADLDDELEAIERYRHMIEFVDGKDPQTGRLLEEILAKKLQHVDDLNDWLDP